MRPLVRAVALLLLAALGAPAAQGQAGEPAPAGRAALPDTLGPAPDGPAPEPGGLFAPAPLPSPWRTAGVLGAGAGAAAWEFARREAGGKLGPTFRVRPDGDYARSADKLGHVFTTGAFVRTFREAYRWAGHDAATARWLGAASGFGAMLYYEVLDGFGTRNAFSPTDLAANTAGAAWATAQDAHAPLRAVNLRLSYWPSAYFDNDPSSDYEGQTMWLALTPGRLAPERAPRWLPPWLGVAAGYGVRAPDAEGRFTEAEWLVGLDLDVDGLPLSGPLWDRLRPILRAVHLPAPAVRLGPRPRLLLLAY